MMILFLAIIGVTIFVNNPADSVSTNFKYINDITQNSNKGQDKQARIINDNGVWVISIERDKDLVIKHNTVKEFITLPNGELMEKGL